MTAYAEIKEMLSAQLMEELVKTKDPRMLGGAELFDNIPYLGHGPMHPSYNPEKE